MLHAGLVHAYIFTMATGMKIIDASYDRACNFLADTSSPIRRAA